ncbi:phosphatase PAP2 family protein [Flectobacillus roseus]|uniref:Phosphatase PAP2 family protein n=1 Tax=Flectobacillus roseus TaxID=502259 RepID=A0ABT6YE85_9BACT|nr:phosphatase PAP2 family protein [Flectobacillus roseus]MDI9861901.1 phosphatase PAP2 family protein [Flectobacillus roseus]
MFKKSFRLVFISFLFLSNITFAQKQTSDSSKPLITAKEMIAPGILIGTGMVFINNSTKAEQKEWHTKYLSSFRTHADDYLQFTPQAAAMGLSLVGIKGKNTFVDKGGIIVLGTGIMLGTVFGLKKLTNITRPDDSSSDSFPSGHTANAFFGATVLATEYGDQSVWYTIGGYTVATATGTFRMLNNRHWLSDVLVGAGIGILSAKASYIIYPWIKKQIAPKLPSNVSFVPVYNGYAVTGNLTIGF